jgi:putative ABC transport system substrate-binding protein
MVNRREFITLLGAAAWPRAGHAQPATFPVVGFLHPGSSATTPYVQGFRRGLQAAGFVEGQNIAVEYRWAEGQYDRLPTLATELVARPVSVIAVGGGTAPILAAKAATSKIPIVFFTGTDPVADGLVESFNRPSGNVTGAYVLVNELVAKQLEVLRETVPAASTIAALDNATSPSSVVRLRELNRAALALGVKLLVVNASTESDVAGAFASLIEQQAGGLVVTPDPFLTSQRDQILALAGRHALPMIASVREFATAGGLMSYGTDFNDGYRVLGVYSGRILKGEKPSDLPVQQAVKVELVVNLKRARTLGLTIPLPLLARADEVIE